MSDNRGESHFPNSTLQCGFTYNAVVPPGPKTSRYIEGAVDLKKCQHLTVIIKAKSHVFLLNSQGDPTTCRTYIEPGGDQSSDTGAPGSSDTNGQLATHSG